jgi:hypothetical protein
MVLNMNSFIDIRFFGVRGLVFLIVFFLILNSYTRIGPIAYYLLPLILLPFLDKFKLIRIDTIFFSFFLFFLFFYP